MMKKTVIVVLVLALLLSLSACGGKTAKVEESKTTTETNQSLTKVETAKEEKPVADHAKKLDVKSNITSLQDDTKAAIETLKSKWSDTKKAIDGKYVKNKNMLLDFYHFCEEESVNYYESVKDWAISTYKVIADSNDLEDYTVWDSALDSVEEAWEDSTTDYNDAWTEIYDELFEQMSDVDDYNDIAKLGEVTEDYWTSYFQMSDCYWDYWTQLSNDYWAVWGAFSANNSDLEDAINKAALEAEQLEENDEPEESESPEEEAPAADEPEIPEEPEEEIKQAETPAAEKPAVDLSNSLENLGDLASVGQSFLKDKLGGLASLFSKDTYEDIYEEYSKKLEDKAPGLVEEYRKEASSHRGDINAQAEICNAKIEILAEIANEGVEKMAYRYYKDMNYETYQDWATKLYDVYMDCAEPITTEYINTAG